MKKITGFILLLLLLSIFQSCSIDEQEVLEEELKFHQEINGKNARSSDAGPSIEGCQIEFTYNNPYLTPAEKAAIRNSYGFFFSYVVVDYDTEIWYVDCETFFDYQDDNPNCDTNGCYIVTSGCPQSGCGSTNPKPDGPTDPFGDDQ